MTEESFVSFLRFLILPACSFYSPHPAYCQKWMPLKLDRFPMIWFVQGIEQHRVSLHLVQLAARRGDLLDAELAQLSLELAEGLGQIILVLRPQVAGLDLAGRLRYCQRGWPPSSRWSLRDRKCIDWLEVGLEAWFVKARSCVHAIFSTRTTRPSRPFTPAFRADKNFNRDRNRDAPFWRGFDVSRLSTGSKSRGVGCSRPSFVSGTGDRGLRHFQGKMVKISPRDLGGEPRILFAIKSSCNRAGS